MWTCCSNSVARGYRRGGAAAHQALAPLLREEIEDVVRQSVTEAIAEELAIGNPAGL